MHWAGLPATTLATLAAGLFAVTALLYILKLRRRAVSVPFSPIWQRVLKDKQSTHLFSQLKRWLSLLLQCALLGLIVLALGDPRLSSAWSQGRNIVVLVDVSASMQASDAAPTRLRVAQNKLRELVQGLPAGDRLMIAEMGPSTRALSSMTGEPAELVKAIDKLAARDTRADLARALQFARDSLQGLSKPEVMLVSDGALGDIERAAEQVPLKEIAKSYLPVGTSDRNVAITQFSVRRYPLDRGRYEVLLEVSNTNPTPVQVELTLFGDGNVIDVTTLALGPSERLPRLYADLSGASSTLAARVRIQGDEPDLLEADNHAYAVMPERRRSKILCVTAGNTYLEAALLLDEYLEVTQVAPDAALPSSQFDVTILDGVAPPLARNHGALLYLNPPAAGAPISHRGNKPISNFGFDTWDKQSPVLSFIAPEDIQVATGFALAPGAGDRVLGASELGPILVSGERSGQRFIALGFDPRNSDLVLRVAWPLFLLNTINNFAAEDTRYLSSFRTGEVWHIPAPAELPLVQLRLPGGDIVQVPTKGGYAVTFGERAGFYSLLNPDGQVLHAFAANLSDLEESRITPAPELKFDAEPAGAVQGFSVGVRRELWIYFLLAVLAVSALEWFSYHRRVTV
jgi:hypothetical protein